MSPCHPRRGCVPAGAQQQLPARRTAGVRRPARVHARSRNGPAFRPGAARRASFTSNLGHVPHPRISRLSGFLASPVPVSLRATIRRIARSVVGFGRKISVRSGLAPLSLSSPGAPVAATAEAGRAQSACPALVAGPSIRLIADRLRAGWSASLGGAWPLSAGRMAVYESDRVRYIRPEEFASRWKRKSSARVLDSPSSSRDLRAASITCRVCFEALARQEYAARPVPKSFDRR